MIRQLKCGFKQSLSFTWNAFILRLLLFEEHLTLNEFIVLDAATTRNETDSIP